jgi:hypothetical protein
VKAGGSTLDRLCGLSTRSVAELLAEIGDPRRPATPGFARFNASAPIPASTAEGPGEPVRHRYNPPHQPLQFVHCTRSRATTAPTDPRGRSAREARGQDPAVTATLGA